MAVLDRAYSLIEVKDQHEDEEMFTVKGVASTPTPDRMGDVVNPMGATFKTPMPLLWQHDHQKPVGHVTFAKPGKSGIPFEAQIPKIKEAGALKDRIDEAIQSVKYKLVEAVSIGFRPLDGDYEFMDSGGIKFNSWEWMELSLVTIPANSEARIDLVKSLDKQFLPASGRDEPAWRKQNPGVSGKKRKRAIQLIPRGN